MQENSKLKPLLEICMFLTTIPSTMKLRLKDQYLIRIYRLQRACLFRDNRSKAMPMVKAHFQAENLDLFRVIVLNSQTIVSLNNRETKNKMMQLPNSSQ